MKLYQLLKKGAKGQTRIEQDFFQTQETLKDDETERITGCCAVGAMVIGAGIDPLSPDPMVGGWPVGAVYEMTDEAGISLYSHPSIFFTPNIGVWKPSTFGRLITDLNDNFHLSFAQTYRCVRLLYRSIGNPAIQERFEREYPGLFLICENEPQEWNPECEELEM